MKRISKLLVIVLGIAFCLSCFTFPVSAENAVSTFSEYYEGEYDSGTRQGYAYIFFGQVSNASTEYGIVITDENGSQREFKGNAIGAEGKFGIAIYNLPDGSYTVKAYSGKESVRVYGSDIVVEKLVYVRDGDTVYFGSYPQSEVTDNTLIYTLNSLAGTLPTSNNSQNWTSYEYRIEGVRQNYMWYIDIISGGEKYRGVYFTKYRPYDTDLSSSTNNSIVDDNGYRIGTTYWFKYEPIRWTILNERLGLILCDMIIDSQQYDATWSNDYETSDIRAWLNDSFYNTAFSINQKNTIKTTTIYNFERTTNPKNNPTYFNGGENVWSSYDNTYDKIFLLSMHEVTNSEYGFNENVDSYDVARLKKTTDYAQSQGCFTSTASSILGNGYWWLRSPHFYNGNISWCVYYVDGTTNDFGYVMHTNRGIVPALQIQL